MAIAHQSTAGQTFSRIEASPASFTVASVVVDSGTDYLTVRIGGEGDGTATQAEVSSMTRDGQSGTRLARAERSDWSWSEIWEIQSPNAGTADLTIVLSESDFAAGRVDGWVGVDGTTPTRTAATGTGSSITASATVAGATSGDVLIDNVTVDGGGKTLNAGANQTGDYTDPGISGCDTAGSQQAGADGGAMTWTWTGSSSWSIVAVAMIPASSGTQVLAARGLSYDVQNTVQASRGLSYDVQAQVQASRALNYDVANSVVASRALSYDLIAFLLVSRALSYDVLAAVLAARGLSYDVLAAGQVQASRALNYDVLAAVLAARGLSYDVLNAVLAARGLSYDVLNSVAARRGLVYDLGDVVISAGATRQGLWYW